jgi:hypothetical protein
MGISISSLPNVREHQLFKKNARKPIDYRCDNEKKNCQVGAPSWYHCIADDSRIPKMPVINPLQALVHPQTQKNHPAWIVKPNANFSELPFLVNRFAD